MDFNSQLQATRSNLLRLEALAKWAPDLMEHADCGIYIQPEFVRAILCNSAMNKAYWLELAGKYRQANWIIEDHGRTWSGELDGVRLTILIGPETKRTEEPQPLFAEGAAA